MGLVLKRGLMNDGSLWFGELPQTVMWDEFRAHLQKLPGASEVGLLADGIAEGWIDFEWRGQHFTIHDQFGDYWFFVKGPNCPDDILEDLLDFCTKILGPPRSGGPP